MRKQLMDALLIDFVHQPLSPCVSLSRENTSEVTL